MIASLSLPARRAQPEKPRRAHLPSAAHHWFWLEPINRSWMLLARDLNLARRTFSHADG